jgi:hypothetical protein
MIHELLLTLLGFTGDILIETPDKSSIQVKPGFDLLTPSERDQLNKIAPLGWYYSHLVSFVEQHEIQWGQTHRVHTYLTAMSLGIQDYLEEYNASIAELENRVVCEGTVPLSYVTQHFQKYLISMPAIWHLCIDVTDRGLHGCQILDYLSFYRSGIPVVKAVVDR